MKLELQELIVNPKLVFWINTLGRPNQAVINAKKIIQSFNIYKRHITVVIAASQPDYSQLLSQISANEDMTWLRVFEYDNLGYDLNNLRMYYYLNGKKYHYGCNCSDRYVYDFDGDKLFETILSADDYEKQIIIPRSILRKRGALLVEGGTNIDVYRFSHLFKGSDEFDVINQKDIAKNIKNIGKRELIAAILKKGYVDSIGDIIVSSDLITNNLLSLASRFDGTYMAPVLIQTKLLSDLASFPGQLLIFNDTLSGRFHTVTQGTNRISRHNWNNVVIGNYLLSWIVPQLETSSSVLKDLSNAIAQADKTEVNTDFVFLAFCRSRFSDFKLKILWNYLLLFSRHQLRKEYLLSREYLKLRFRSDVSGVPDKLEPYNNRIDLQGCPRKILTIYIPTYRREHYVLQNLLHLAAIILSDSFLLKSIDIVVVDNGSPEILTRQIKSEIRKLPSELSLFLYELSENYGVGGNFVRGYKNVHTDYVMFCGDDDFLHPGYLKRVIQKLYDEPEVNHIFHCSIHGVFPSGHLGSGRDLGSPPRSTESFTRYADTFLSHQLSGLTLKMGSISPLLSELHRCNVHDVDHIYTALTAYSMLVNEKSFSHYLTDTPVLVHNNAIKVWKHDEWDSLRHTAIAISTAVSHVDKVRFHMKMLIVYFMLLKFVFRNKRRMFVILLFFYKNIPRNIISRSSFFFLSSLVFMRVAIFTPFYLLRKAVTLILDPLISDRNLKKFMSPFYVDS